MSIEKGPKVQVDFQNIPNRSMALFLISVLGLFFEMLLIRWIGTEVRIFAYLQNTILIACFLGLGLGCFTSRLSVDLKDTLVPLTLLLILMAIPSSRMALGMASEFLSVLGDLVIWGSWSPMSKITNVILIFAGILITYFLLIFVVYMFVPIGRILARLMDEHPNTIWAYSINVAGSLLGIWLFVILSYFHQPPFTWFLFLGALLVIFVVWMKKNIKVNLALLGLIIFFSWFAGAVPGSEDVIWSPYQKLVVNEMVIEGQKNGDYIIQVNNTQYQGIIDLSIHRTSSDPKRFPPEHLGFSQYDLPILFHPDPKKYLIVGAGAGNDVAAALRYGVEDITAVEIDPAIIRIGQKYHPENPYSSTQVQIVADDARSFFANATKKYDVISFGLLDSHTTTAMTNARLDHYVYTKESILLAKSLLADGGVIVLTFEAQKPFISDRIARVLTESFGEEPIIFRIPRSWFGWGGVMFVTGDLDAVYQQIEKNSKLEAYINKLSLAYPIDLPQSTNITTDDWPYIYLESPKIPILFYILAILFLLLFFQSKQKWGATKISTHWSGSHWHFFFLGSAFLLLEVQNISKASVVFGNTWETNAVIISGVLTMILIANWIADRFPNLKIGFVYIGLITITIALYFVNLSQFSDLSSFYKVIVVGGLTTLPMLFSGIIFIRSFSIFDRKDEALGANLIGSLIGAILQSVTFIVGIKALLLIVAGFYFLSIFFKPRQVKLF